MPDKCNDHITVTSFMTIKCDSIAVENRDLQQMLFSLRCIQYISGKCFMRPAMHVCCEVFAHHQESVVNKE